MPEAQVIDVWIVEGHLRTDVDGLRVQLMHIVDEGEVVVGMQVRRVEVCAQF